MSMCSGLLDGSGPTQDAPTLGVEILARCISAQLKQQIPPRLAPHDGCRARVKEVPRMRPAVNSRTCEYVKDASSESFQAHNSS